MMPRFLAALAGGDRLRSSQNFTLSRGVSSSHPGEIRGGGFPSRAVLRCLEACLRFAPRKRASSVLVEPLIDEIKGGFGSP